MAEILRPMSTGELMDRTLVLYKKNFKLFVGIATVGPLASLLFQLLTLSSASVPAATGRKGVFAGATVGIGMVTGIIVIMAGVVIAHGATVKAVAAVHLGRTITVLESYKSLRGKILRILGVFFWMLMLAVGVLVVGAFAVALALLLMGLAMAGLGIRTGTPGERAPMIVGLIGLGVILFIILAVAIVWVRYLLAIAACTVEDLGVFASLKRSSALSKGSRVRVFLVYVVFVVLSLTVHFTLTGLVTLAGARVPSAILRLTMVYAAGFIAGSLTGPLATIGLALVYYDERVRKEAFDLQWMMSSLDSSVPAAPQVMPAQS